MLNTKKSTILFKALLTVSAITEGSQRHLLLTFHFNIYSKHQPNVPIPDSHLTASSHFLEVGLPSRARLGEQGAWCPSEEEKNAVVPNFYLQVCSITFDMGLFVICFCHFISQFISWRVFQIISVVRFVISTMFIWQGTVCFQRENVDQNIILITMYNLSIVS